MNTISELHAFFRERDLSSYDRQNFDRFLKAIHFSFILPAIHVTGTNGKGSTVNYLMNIYRHAGYRVGVFSSPFFEIVNEMITIDGQAISDSDILRLFNVQEENFHKYALTSFEIQTYLAFSYFSEQRLDLAIIEVGMGGYLDATNIFVNILAIITSVSLEHTQYLGKSISEIAKSKSGIIKEERPVLVGKLDESAMFAIRETAKRNHAPLFVVEDYNDVRDGDGLVFDYRPYHDLKLNTIARYQLKNAALAVEATKILSARFSISEEDVRAGLSAAGLANRFERFADRIVVDGAHNPEAMENLIETLNASEKRPIHVVFAAFRDKNYTQMLSILNRDTASITLTTFAHKRARNKDDYFLYLSDYDYRDDYREAIDSLLARYPLDVLLITGSLAFASLARKYIVGKKI